MNDHENRTRERFARVDDFGDARSNDFAATSLGKQFFGTLKTIIAELNELAASEASGFGSARQGTSTRSEARDRLRAKLEAISRTARAMSNDVPGIDDKFRLPAVGNDQRLLTVARAFAADAAPLSAQFIAHEMPADFLADLNADIAALEAAISDQSSGVGDHVSARAAIDDAIARGLEILRKLDAIIRNKYADRSEVLAEWTTANHAERAPSRKPSTAPTPPPKPPAA